MTETHKPKLLIIEDDEGLQRQLRWAYDDYEVVVAGDRTSAIDALRAEAPAVVTLDLGLPPDPDGVSEGFATLAEILALKPDTKVIIASGHGARESAMRAIASGAYDFYQKPVDIDELGMIVSRGRFTSMRLRPTMQGLRPNQRLMPPCLAGWSPQPLKC